MVKSSLINILEKLSAKELKDFTLFVASPFFNTNENSVRLLAYIKKFHPDFPSDKVNKKKVFSRLFHGRKYNDGFMRSIIHNLGRLADDYISYLRFKSDPLQSKISLINELNSRKIEKSLLKNYKEVEIELNKTVAATESQFYNQYIALEIMHQYSNWSRFKAKHLKDSEESLMFSKMENLTKSYLLGLLSDYRILLWRTEYENIQFEMGFADNIISYLRKHEDLFKDTTGIILHLYEILLLREKKTVYFFILKDMLLNKSNQLTHDQRYSLHNILQNFASKQVFNGNDEFKNERFELNKIALKQNLFKGSDDLYFDDLLFGLVVFNSTSIGEYEWTEKFIEKYKHMLAPDNYNIVVNVALARLYISSGEFKKALNCLNQIKTVKHIQYKYPVKDLLLMVFYELSIYPQAHYQLDSYRHFINKYKNYFPKDRIERISNFTKFYSKLIKLKENFHTSGFEELAGSLRKCFNVMNRDWLTAKLKEMEKANA